MIMGLRTLRELPRVYQAPVSNTTGGVRNSLNFSVACRNSGESGGRFTFLAVTFAAVAADPAYTGRDSGEMTDKEKPGLTRRDLAILTGEGHDHGVDKPESDGHPPDARGRL